MSPSSLQICVYTSLVLATFLVCARGQGSREEQVQASMIAQMSKIQQQLAEVTNTTQQMLAEIERTVLDCLGMNSELCETLEREAALLDTDGLLSPWSPGKRKRSSTNLSSTKANRLYNELKRKEAVTKHLENLIKGASNMITNEKKRSCNLNLGFHCQTSEIMDFMDYYNYLNSARSPGKKRSAPSAGSTEYRPVP